MTEASSFSFETKELENGEREVSVVVGKDAFEASLKKMIAEFKPHVQIKGFRKGKAPDGLILSNYRERIESECEREFMQEAWKEFSENNSIKAFGEPHLENIKREDTLTLTYRFFPMGSVTIPDLSSIKIEKNIYKVDDSSVKKGEEKFNSMFAQYKEVEDGCVENGDRVTIDINFLEEKNRVYNQSGIRVLAGGDDNNLYVAKNIDGMKKDEEKDIETKVSGEKSKMRVKVVKIERAIKPEKKEEEKEEKKEGEEEKDNSRKDWLKISLENVAKQKSETSIYDGIFKELSENTKVDIPKGYLEQYTDSLFEQMRSDIEQNFGTLEHYLALNNQDADEIREEQKQRAEKLIRRDAAFREILEANKEEIKVDQQKVQQIVSNAYTRQMNNGLNRLPREQQERYMYRLMEEAQNQVRSEAVTEFIKSKITIGEKAEEAFVPTEQDFQSMFR